MVTFQRIFQTRQQAMDTYRTQLSHQQLYVESFEGYAKGTDVSVELSIRETGQRIELYGKVERCIGRTEVKELGYGTRPGLLINVPITAAMVEPLRAFFLSTSATTHPGVSRTATAVPKASEVVRPSFATPKTEAVRPAAAPAPEAVRPAPVATPAPEAVRPAPVAPAIPAPDAPNPEAPKPVAEPRKSSPGIVRPTVATVRTAQPPEVTSNADNSSSGIIRPTVTTIRTAQAPDAIPLAHLPQCTGEQAITEIDKFITLTDRGSLYAFFNTRPDVERKTLQKIYRSVVRILHPDSHAMDNEKLADKLGEAYQVFNEAYRILQNPVQRAIYQEISQSCHNAAGLSLTAYRKWMSDYSLRNSQNIRLAEDLVAKAQAAASAGKTAEVAESLRLALQYDPYNEKAREMSAK